MTGFRPNFRMSQTKERRLPEKMRYADKNENNADGFFRPHFL